MGNLERDIAEKESLPVISENLDSSVIEHSALSKEEITREGRDTLSGILNSKNRIGRPSTAVIERFKKRGRPEVSIDQKALKVSVSIPRKIGDELKERYKDKKLSSAIQEVCLNYLYIRKAQDRLIDELKKELGQVGSLIEDYESKRKWDDIRPIVTELKSKVQNFLKLVRLVGLVQKIPDKSNQKILVVRDFLFEGLPANYQRLYQFCQYWELNGYPDSLF